MTMQAGSMVLWYIIIHILADMWAMHDVKALRANLSWQGMLEVEAALGMQTVLSRLQAQA